MKNFVSVALSRTSLKCAMVGSSGRLITKRNLNASWQVRGEDLVNSDINSEELFLDRGDL